QRVNRHFHHPYNGFGGNPVLQTNGLLEQVSVFGQFFAYQILPDFTNFYQECVAKGVRRGSKRQLTGGFSRPIYLNRVKSRGSCQAVTRALPCWFPTVFGREGKAFSNTGEGEYLRFPRTEPGDGRGQSLCFRPLRAQPAFRVRQPLARLPLGHERCRATFRGSSRARESARPIG